ncbi:hypothetical protein [Tissierella sp.]|uniref:hypothetical protein n=1 Tax=Tissierella sp. TaxID=41274 RepID=UPI0028A958B9|nr:hypothetical protein [Tissierella sp.]
MENIKIKDPKIKKNIIIIALIVLIILTVKLYKDNRRLKNRIASSNKSTMDLTTISLPKGWILPILSEKPIDLNELYRLDGILRMSNSLFINDFGLTEFMKIEYFENTRIGVQRLIKLIESNADDKEIDKLVNELIEMQNDILENPLDVHKAKSFYLK